MKAFKNVRRVFTEPLERFSVYGDAVVQHDDGLIRDQLANERFPILRFNSRTVTGDGERRQLMFT